MLWYGTLIASLSSTPSRTSSRPSLSCLDSVAVADGGANGGGNCVMTMADFEEVPSFSYTEALWVCLEVGFFVDQRHQGVTSGFRSRLQWRVAYVITLAALVMRTLSLVITDYSNSLPWTCFQAFQVPPMSSFIAHR